jgi:uncharacterized protein YihD (DUF1040 family)
MNRNNNFTDDFFNKLSSENGNAFYIKSSYSTFSTVWSYQTGKIEIYNISNGKIQKEEKLDAENFIKKIPKKRVFELDKCMELDGDIMGYKVDLNNKLYKEDFPIGMNCFLNEKYESEFFNMLVRDVDKFNLYNIKSE